MAENNSDPRNRTIDFSLNAMYISNMWGRPKRPLKGDVNKDGIVNNTDRELLQKYIKYRDARMKVDKRQADVDSKGDFNQNDYDAFMQNMTKDGYFELIVNGKKTAGVANINIQIPDIYTNFSSTIPYTEINHCYKVDIPEDNTNGIIKAKPVAVTLNIGGTAFDKGLTFNSNGVDYDLILIPSDIEAVNLPSYEAIGDFILPSKFKGLTGGNGSNYRTDLNIDGLTIISSAMGDGSNFLGNLNLKNISLITNGSFYNGCHFYKDVNITNVNTISSGSLNGNTFDKNLTINNIDLITNGAFNSCTIYGDLVIDNITTSINNSSATGLSVYGDTIIKDLYATVSGFSGLKTNNLKLTATKANCTINGGFGSMGNLNVLNGKTYDYPNVYIEGYKLISSFSNSTLKDVYIKNCTTNATDTSFNCTAPYSGFTNLTIENCNNFDGFAATSKQAETVTIKNSTVKLFANSSYGLWSKKINIDNSEIKSGSFDKCYFDELHIKDSKYLCSSSFYKANVGNKKAVFENVAFYTAPAYSLYFYSYSIDLTLDNITGCLDTLNMTNTGSDTFKNVVTIKNCKDTTVSEMFTWNAAYYVDRLYFDNNEAMMNKAANGSVTYNIKELIIGKNQTHPMFNPTLNTYAYASKVVKLVFEDGWNETTLPAGFLRGLAFAPATSGGAIPGVAVLPESITTIETGALGNGNLYSFVFGPNVTSIASNSISTDSNGFCVFKGTTPPEFYSNGSSFVNVSAIYVPDDSIEAYRTAMSSVTSTNIVGMSTMSDALKTRIAENTYHEE